MLNSYNCATIYVSQANGNDNFNGYSPYSDGAGNGPIKSLGRACYMLQSMRSCGVNQPFTVKIMGDYHLSETLGIGFNHAPRFFGNHYPMNNITFESYNDENYPCNARLIGGKKLTGFKKDTFNGRECISLFIPEVRDGKWHFTDLYVNGKAANRTRYPKNDTLTAVVTENPVNDEFFTGSKWFVAHKEDLEGIDGIENSTVSFYHYWIDEHSPVESYDPESGKITMKYRSRFEITVDYKANLTSDLHYYLENIPQTFSDPGEWYLDVPAGMLYYIPENGFDSFEELEILAPTLEKLISVDGTPDNKPCGIRFRNLDVICSKGDYVSTYISPRVVEKFPGENQFASDIQSACGAYGAIHFENAVACSVENCNISCVGVHAVEINHGCENIRVQNCAMKNIGGGGVKIWGGEAEQDPSLATGNCIIRGNTITNCGKRLAAACGILVCHSANNEISENEICYLDYSGISCGWVWGYKPSSTYANRICNNHIHHIGMGRLSDMGGIYLLGYQNGTVVSGNLIHDVNSAHYGGWGLYTDEGSSYITIEKNIVYNCKSNCYHQHYGSYNTVRDNIFAFGGDSIVRMSAREEHIGIVFENNTFITDGKPIYTVGDGNYCSPPPSMRTNHNTMWDVSGQAPIVMRMDKEKNLSLEDVNKLYDLDIGSAVKLPGNIEVDVASKSIMVK